MIDKSFVIETHQCGWCRKAIEDGDLTAHALACPEQPYRVYQRVLIESLLDGFGVKSPTDLPLKIRVALYQANMSALSHIEQVRWAFP